MVMESRRAKRAYVTFGTRAAAGVAGGPKVLVKWESL